VKHSDQPDARPLSLTANGLPAGVKLLLEFIVLDHADALP
jgi:hypothetical protein